MEVNQVMCSIATQTILMNGFSSQCSIICNDVRRLSIGPDPDADLAAAADICIYEVRIFWGTCPDRRDPKSLDTGKLRSSEPLRTPCKIQLGSHFLENCAVGDTINAMQVFDNGLIGEGVLHLLHWAVRKLLHSEAILVRN